MPKSIRGKHSLYWLATFNNYTEDELQTWLVELNDKCKMFVMQEEMGESGTPHLQCKICLLKSARPIETFSCKKIHWEQSKKWKGWQYCCKDESNNGRRWSKGVDVPEPLIVHEPYGWQLEVVDLVKAEPKERKVHWFWSEKTPIGRSSLARYLAIKHDVKLIDGTRASMRWLADMETPPTAVQIDLRGLKKRFKYYASLQKIKDGVFFSEKKRDMVIWNKCPHVIVFASFEPEYEKLSADRWVVKKIDV
jgi:hypothetical protein